MKIKSVLKVALFALVILNGVYLHANKDTAEFAVAYSIIHATK